MNFFPPKSFLSLSRPINRGKSRIGQFIIKIPSLDTQEIYWVYIRYNDNEYSSLIKKNELSITSPFFLNEIDAVRWLEKELINLIDIKVNKVNLELKKQIDDNFKYVDDWRTHVCAEKD